MINIKESGFTLVELLVVIGMVSALAGFFVVNTTSSRNIQKLDIAAKQVVSVIREAQAMGQSGRAYGDQTDSNRFDYGYGVYIPDPGNNGANGINYISVYGGAGVDVADIDDAKYVPDNEVAKHMLPQGVVVYATLSDANNKKQVHIHFRRGESIAHLIDNVDNNITDYRNKIDITLSYGTQTRTVTVNKFGLIYYQ